MKRVQLAIVGAGPAGLIAALVARKVGLECQVFEQAPDFKHVGGGIVLHSNGLRVLEALDILEPLKPKMQLHQHLCLETSYGRELDVIDLSRLSIPQNSFAVILRYELQEHLLAAARRTGGGVLFGRRCVGVTARSGKASLRFENGEVWDCDVVIAADGSRSTLRENIGLNARTRPDGAAALRGVANIQIRQEGVREIWGADGRFFGICPLLGKRTYFYCSAPLGRWTEIRENTLRAWIESWRLYPPEVHLILNAVSDWQRVNYDELSEIHLARWAKPPVFLVGDAAHAMTPYLGQGANSAMVDSLVLVRLLSQAPEGYALEDVMRSYESLRQPLVRRIQSASRFQGQLTTLRWGLAQLARDLLWPLAMNLGPLRRRGLLMAAGYDQALESFYGFDRSVRI